MCQDDDIFAPQNTSENKLEWVPKTVLTAVRSPFFIRVLLFTTSCFANRDPILLFPAIAISPDKGCWDVKHLKPQ